MASSDVSSKRVTAVGSLAVGPARVRQVQVLTDNVGPGRLTLTNGDGGPTLLDLDFLQNDSHSVNIPGNGIRFESDVWVSVETNVTAVTVFYS
tara:strand:- start:598 stop:876 length:279 start_codon:yes stop_codon:yes gene_type:complete